jgi:hypothetical protein
MPPTRNHELPPHLRTRIFELQDRTSAGSILKLLKRPSLVKIYSAANRLQARSTSSRSSSNKPRIGSPVGFTEDERNHLIKFIELNPAITYTTLQAQESLKCLNTIDKIVISSDETFEMHTPHSTYFNGSGCITTTTTGRSQRHGV